MAAAQRETLGLVGDIGGTNARFALAKVAGGRIRISHVKVLHAANYPTGDAALEAYLSGLGAKARPRLAVIAAAGPVTRGAVAFTNNTAWRFSEAGVTKVGKLDAARLINDFTAQALALDHLTPPGLHRIGPRGAPVAGGSMVVLGPGTGFGAAARINDGFSRATVTGEAGHMGLAPADDLEVEILRRLMARFGRTSDARLSVEWVLSGAGLLNLYQTLAEIRGEAAPLNEPTQVTEAGLAGQALPRLALDRFCAILGSVAGDLALAFGARKGVYISGGIAPRILDVLAASDFRRRFEDKDRMADYLRPIPTRVVIDPHAALIGAASLLEGLNS